MADIEKVIKGLQICKTEHGKCTGCPYDGDFPRCTTNLCKDALELLKEQQERIKTLESLRRIEQEGR